jgi:tetratricopeptide (TPR) repeat protein
MLTDFGVSRAFERDGGMTQTGMILGSPRYMSPEQASGDRAIDGRSDLYSLALVAYEMFAGAPVVQSGTIAGMLVKHITETPLPLAEKVPDVPPHVAEAIDRGLAKDPADRWQTGRAFAEALAGHSLTPTGEITGARARRGSKKRFSTGLIAAAAIVLAAAAGAWWKFGGAPVGTAYLVAPFEIQSGDQSVNWLREGSVNMLTLTLGQWSDLNVVDYERTLSLLDKAELGDKARLSLDDAMRVARLANAGTVVTGQVQTLNDSLQVTAKLYSVKTGKFVLATAGVPLGSDPRPLFDDLARQLLNVEGGGRTSTMQLAQATTNNLEAYRAYLNGVKLLNTWRLQDADTAFARATELDSTFALAYHKRSLGLGWSDASGPNYLPVTNRAFALMGRLPQRERALVEGHYHLVQALQAVNSRDPARDTSAAPREFQAAIKSFSDLIARGDSLVPEAWYGLADAYFHARIGGTPPEQLRDYTARALRGFNRTLAIDSSFHLAYSHLVQLYNATAFGAQLLITGDSALFLDAATGARLQTAGVDKIRNDARKRGLEIATAWSRADEKSVQPFIQLAQSYVAAERPDSAIAALRTALEGNRSGAPGARLTMLGMQMSADDPGFASTMRYMLDRFTRDSLRQAPSGTRFSYEGELMAAAAMAGRGADVDKAARLFYASDSVLPGTKESSAEVIEFFRLALHVGMGDSMTPATKTALLAGMRGLEGSGAVGEQARAGAASVPYLAFLASHDTAFSVVAKRWANGQMPELDALAALRRGDTATARQIASAFTKPDSLRKARFGLGGMRSVARAEVLDAVGLTRQAAETYEATEMNRINRTSLSEPGYAVWVRTFLARARLWAELGERDKAVAAYEQFIRRWADADGVAAKQVAQARQELAQLRDSPPKR